MASKSARAITPISRCIPLTTNKSFLLCLFNGLTVTPNFGLLRR